MRNKQLSNQEKLVIQERGCKFLALLLHSLDIKQFGCGNKDLDDTTIKYLVNMNIEQFKGWEKLTKEQLDFLETEIQTESQYLTISSASIICKSILNYHGLMLLKNHATKGQELLAGSLKELSQKLLNSATKKLSIAKEFRITFLDKMKYFFRDHNPLILSIFFGLMDN